MIPPDSSSTCTISSNRKTKLCRESRHKSLKVKYINWFDEIMRLKLFVIFTCERSLWVLRSRIRSCNSRRRVWLRSERSNKKIELGCLKHYLNLNQEYSNDNLVTCVATWNSPKENEARDESLSVKRSMSILVVMISRLFSGLLSIHLLPFDKREFRETTLVLVYLLPLSALAVRAYIISLIKN